MTNKIDKLKELLGRKPPGGYSEANLPLSVTKLDQNPGLLEASELWDMLVMGDPSLTTSEVREMHRAAIRGTLALDERIRQRSDHHRSHMTSITLERAVALGLNPMDGSNLDPQENVHHVFENSLMFYQLR